MIQGYKRHYKAKEKQMECHLTIGVPKYLPFCIKTKCTVFNEQYHFYDEKIFEPGKYKLTLTKENENICLWSEDLEEFQDGKDEK